jgi:GT2 family glycosyltransferase
MGASLPPVAIVVLNYNGLSDTTECLRSIARNDYPALLTLVVDNASDDDPTPALRDEFPCVRVLRTPVNSGWAGGNNVGIRAALEQGCKYVILLNNDTVVAPDFAERLVAAALQFPEYGVIGPVINDMNEPDRVQTDGCRFNGKTGKGFFERQVVRIVGADQPHVSETDIVNGCCLMLSEKVVRTIGLIEEQFFLIHEESDFCLRARRAGFRCGILAAPLVWHRQSQSFERVGLRVQRYYDTRNLYLLLKRHRDHDRGRSRLRSWIEYYKYAYYRFCIEREAGQPEAANAVVDGVCDAWSHKFGVYRERRRLMFPVVAWMFEMVRRIKAANPRGMRRMSRTE